MGLINFVLCVVFFDKFFSISQLNSHLYIFFSSNKFQKTPTYIFIWTIWTCLDKEFFSCLWSRAKRMLYCFGLESRAGLFCEVTFLDIYFSESKNYSYKSWTYLQIFEPALKTCSDCSKNSEKFGLVHSIQHWFFNENKYVCESFVTQFLSLV